MLQHTTTKVIFDLKMIPWEEYFWNIAHDSIVSIVRRTILEKIFHSDQFAIRFYLLELNLNGSHLKRQSIYVFARLLLLSQIRIKMFSALKKSDRRPQLIILNICEKAVRLHLKWAHILYFIFLIITS